MIETIVRRVEDETPDMNDWIEISREKWNGRLLIPTSAGRWTVGIDYWKYRTEVKTNADILQ